MLFPLNCLKDHWIPWINLTKGEARRIKKRRKKRKKRRGKEEKKGREEVKGERERERVLYEQQHIWVHCDIIKLDTHTVMITHRISS